MATPTTSHLTLLRLNVLVSAISLSVGVVAFIAWGQSYQWPWGHFTLYQIFPIFGLLAFSLMWSHYVASVIRQVLKLDRQVLHTYFEVTSFLVLTAILLHPGLLIWKLWRDGFGLPPHSYIRYVFPPSMRWLVLLSSTSLLIFLAYELRRLFGKRSWWRFFQYAADLAMLAIFYHGLRLGDALQKGWFRFVWFFYGATLIGCLIYIYYHKIVRARSTH